MAKRIVIKIGNVFCVEIDGRYKCYFQYVCNDLSMLNGSVIRVFKTRYPMDYEPVVKDIVRDEVAFHAHTVLRAGIFHEAWYKVGPSAIISDAHEKVLWGITRSTKFSFDDMKTTFVDPMEHWVLWYTNEEPIQDEGELPEIYRDKVEFGAVMPFVDIVNRIQFGYYKYQICEYDRLKRIPHPDVDSYTKTESGDSIVYSHFKGETVIQKIIVYADGTVKAIEGDYLDCPKFWETNWKHREFIAEEDFREAWSKYSGESEKQEK